MDIVNTSSLASPGDLSVLFIAVDQRLQAFFNMYTSQYEQYSMKIPTTTAVEKLPFLHLFPQFAEWVPGTLMPVHNYVLSDIMVENKTFILRTEILKQQIEDDQFGAFLNMAPARIARQAKTLPDKEITKLIEANPVVNWDSTALFSTSHPIDPTGNTTTATQSNLLANLDDGYAVGGLTPGNLAAARALHLKRKGMDNQPLGLMTEGLAIMCPAEAELDARVAATAAFYPASVANGAGPVSNVFANLPAEQQYKVIVNTRLTDANSWYLLSTKEDSSFVYWSERTPIEYTSITDPQNPLVFERETYALKGRTRGAAFAGLYYTATKGTSNS